MVRKKHRSKVFLTTSLVMALLFIIQMAPRVAAVDPSVRVFAPTAYSEFDFMGVIGAPGMARMLDGDPLALSSSGAYAATEYYAPRTFYNTTYQEYWPPYENRSNFPSNTATIVSLSAIAIVRCQVPRDFSLYVWYWNGSASMAMKRIDGPTYTAGTDDALYSWNITALAPEALVPQVLKGTLGQFMVYILCGDYTRPLYVDYLGIDYTWTNTTVPSPSTGTGAFGVPSIPGFMGLFGFFGMIAMPAAGIWLARNSDQGKMRIGLMVIVSFALCFALFLFSLGL